MGGTAAPPHTGVRQLGGESPAACGAICAAWLRALRGAPPFAVRGLSGGLAAVVRGLLCGALPFWGGCLAGAGPVGTACGRTFPCRPYKKSTRAARSSVRFGGVTVVPYLVGWVGMRVQGIVGRNKCVGLTMTSAKGGRFGAWRARSVTAPFRGGSASPRASLPSFGRWRLC